MNPEQDIKRMVDSLDEPAEVRAMLRAGIDDQVTDYDYARGLAQHMAAVVWLPDVEGTESVGQPSTGQPSTGQPSTAQPSTAQPSTAQPSTAQGMANGVEAASQAAAWKAAAVWLGVPLAAGSVAVALWVADVQPEPGAVPAPVPASAPFEHAPVAIEVEASDEVAASEIERGYGPGGGDDDGEVVVAVEAPGPAPGPVARGTVASRKLPVPPVQRGFAPVQRAPVAEASLPSAADREDAVREPAVQEAEREGAAQRARDEADARLQREMAQLMRAKRALQHDPVQALALARQGEREFQDSLFTEERQHVLLLALIELGRLDEARRLAEPYLRRYPNSPFARRVQNALLQASR
jgi:hypothetical protein